MEFTKKVLATLTLPPNKFDHIEWDPSLPGFGMRLRGNIVNATIKRTWIIQYKIGSQHRRKSIGDIRKINLDDARKIARKRFAKNELGFLIGTLLEEVKMSEGVRR